MGSWSVASRHTGMPAGVREHAVGRVAERRPPAHTRSAQASIRRGGPAGIGARSRRGVGAGVGTCGPVCRSADRLSAPLRGCDGHYIVPSPRRYGTTTPKPGLVCYHTGPAARKGLTAVDGTLLASNLGFPEGPVVMPDGSIVFCDGNTGELRGWKDGTLGTYAVHRRLAVGRRARHRRRDLRHPGRQRPRQRRPERDRRDPARERGRVGRAALVEHRRPRRWPAPTTSPSAPTAGCGSPTRAPSRTTASRPPTVRRGGCSCSAPAATASSLMERPDVYPNGIAFDAQKRMYWTESAAHRVCRLEDGEATVWASSPTATCPTAWRSPPTAARSCARRSRTASRCSRPTARCSRRSTSASTPPTASSTARRST